MLTNTKWPWVASAGGVLSLSALILCFKMQNPKRKRPKYFQRVVVVGASFAGIRAANFLAPLFPTTVVERKDFFEYTPGILRCLVEPSHTRQVLVPLSDVMSRRVQRLCQTTVVAIHDSHVELANGEKLPFDILVIATGSEYSIPIKPAIPLAHAHARTANNAGALSRSSRIQEIGAHSRSSTGTNRVASCVVVGGGFAGVELAAELVTCSPARTVSMVCSSDTPACWLPERAQKCVAQFFQKHRVQVINNMTLLVGDSKAEAQVNVRHTVHAGTPPAVVYRCTGPQYHALKHILGDEFSGKQTEATEFRGLVTNEFLQLPDQPHIFVVGDALASICPSSSSSFSNSPLLHKNIPFANATVDVAVENILRTFDGRVRPLISFLSNPRWSQRRDAVCLSLGRSNGVLVIRGGRFVVKGWLVGVLRTAIDKINILQLKGNWFACLLTWAIERVI
eukprot:c10857_g1_i1.p1 GENE.c10857_g1_i1~~c10857_g1_i1.p1  ORF type:complete len:452 (+),score=94.36 c10857_g1_i1:68-1423(+)